MANCQTQLADFIYAQSKLLKLYKGVCYLMVFAELFMIVWILHYRFRGKMRLNWFTQTMIVLLILSSALQFLFDCLVIRAANPTEI